MENSKSPETTANTIMEGVENYTSSYGGTNIGNGDESTHKENTKQVALFYIDGMIEEWERLKNQDVSIALVQERFQYWHDVRKFISKEHKEEKK